MKTQPTPYYNLPTCYFERLPDSDTMGMTPHQQMGQMGQPTQQGTDLLAPITPTTQPQALTLTSVEYLNGFLRTQIGRRVRVEFLIGTGTLLDRTGTLISVGANYINIKLIESDDIMTCDFFSIKFVTFLL